LGRACNRLECLVVTCGEEIFSVLSTTVDLRFLGDRFFLLGVFLLAEVLAGSSSAVSSPSL
jgi:hypothetical protein